MTYVIGIHPDNYGTGDASSPRWAQLLEDVGHEVRWVDAYRADILEQLEGCHGFMWRWAHFGGMHRIAQRLLPVLERYMGLVVYPDQNTCWHYDDKIAQAYLFRAAGIPTPRTWVWFDRDAAANWSLSAQFPLVMKLHTGAGSQNVRLVENREEALVWIDAMFTYGLHNLAALPSAGRPWSWSRRLRAAAKAAIKGRPLVTQATAMDALPDADRQKGYVLFQEFLPGNAFDTRVTVIGKRAFAFRRFARPNDFRASGSGRIDYDRAAIDERFVRLAFQTAQRLRSHSCAIDGLYDAQGKHVVGEISYTYVSHAVRACSGHWKLAPNTLDGQPCWVAGAMWPEEAQVADFLERLEQRPHTACELHS